jgi:hypothetical protein
MRTKLLVISLAILAALPLEPAIAGHGHSGGGHFAGRPIVVVPGRVFFAQRPFFADRRGFRDRRFFVRRHGFAGHHNFAGRPLIVERPFFSDRPVVVERSFQPRLIILDPSFAGSGVVVIR